MLLTVYINNIFSRMRQFKPSSYVRVIAARTPRSGRVPSPQPRAEETPEGPSTESICLLENYQSYSL